MTSTNHDTKTIPGTSAPGAVQLSPPALISASPEGACQTARDPIEPGNPVSTCTPRAEGNAIDRRTAIMNMIASTAAMTSTARRWRETPRTR